MSKFFEVKQSLKESSDKVDQGLINMENKIKEFTEKKKKEIEILKLELDESKKLIEQLQNTIKSINNTCDKSVGEINKLKNENKKLLEYKNKNKTRITELSRALDNIYNFTLIRKNDKSNTSVIHDEIENVVNYIKNIQEENKKDETETQNIINDQIKKNENFIEKLNKINNMLI